MSLMTKKNQELPSLEEANSFLSRYATMLLECGATCIRIEKNINRIAQAFHMDISMVIMPSYIQFIIEDAAHTHSYSSIRRISKIYFTNRVWDKVLSYFRNSFLDRNASRRDVGFDKRRYQFRNQ